MPREDEIPTGNTEGIDADALLEAVESGHEIPAQDPVPVEPPAAPVDEIVFTSDGNEVRVPRGDPRVTQWLSQGHTFSQKMAAFNQREEQFKKQSSEFDQRQKDFDSQYKTYQTIEEYAKQHPEWWSKVEESYQQALQAGQNANDQGQPIPKWVQDKLAKFDQLTQKIEAKEADDAKKEQAAKDTADDQALTSAMKSIREQYPTINFDQKDERGSSLEDRVIEHAVKNGIGSYQAAFRDYNHDNLIKFHADKAKENQTKELQKRNRLGLLGQTPTPTKVMKPTEGVKNKSYNDIEREIRDELGIA